MLARRFAGPVLTGERRVEAARDGVRAVRRRHARARRRLPASCAGARRRPGAARRRSAPRAASCRRARAASRSRRWRARAPCWSSATTSRPGRRDTARRCRASAAGCVADRAGATAPGRLERGAARRARRRARRRGGGRGAARALRRHARALRRPGRRPPDVSRPSRLPARRHRRASSRRAARGASRHDGEGPGEAGRAARPRATCARCASRSRSTMATGWWPCWRLRVSGRSSGIPAGVCGYRRAPTTIRGGDGTDGVALESAAVRTGVTESMVTQAGPAVLVAQTSFLGDVVLTTPLLAALRRAAAPAPAGRAGAARGRVRCWRGIPTSTTCWWTTSAVRDRGARRRRRAWRAGCGGERFDLAVSPHRSLRTAIVLAAARIPRRIGFADSRGAFLFHERVARDRRQHDVERNLALAAPFGGASGAPRLHLPVQRGRRRAGDGPAARRRGPLVGLAPGSVWATKRWTAEGFAGVLRALRAAGRPRRRAGCAGRAVAGRGGRAARRAAARPCWRDEPTWRPWWR